jgi:diguanylate cyclase (GGDEF)-like protein
MSARPGIRPDSAARRPGSVIARVRAFLPHGGSLPESEWRSRHRLICALLGVMVVVVAVYALAGHGTAAVSDIPAVSAMLAFAGVALWSGASRKWRSVSAAMGLLTGAAALVDISGGLIELHFTFFIVVLILTLYEDWGSFLLAVGFVLIHHGVMGTIDPRAVFDSQREWRDPWAWAALHALFVALAGAAGVTAWGLNERVRDGMREAQRQLEVIGLTDPLTGLGNRRRLMNDVEEAIADGRDSALAIFDLDGFKEYNDRFGHPAGDSLLVRLTAVLRDRVQGTGRAYRLGGDEFCVLADPLRPEELAALLSDWTAALHEQGDGFQITACSGAALIPREAPDASEALRLCDRRMYAQKHSRRPSAASQSKDVLVAAVAARRDSAERAGDVAIAAERIGRELGMAGARLQDLAYAAELHDVGMIAVPESILAKPGPLDDREWDLVQRHPVIGERILAAAPALAAAARIVRATHERHDGSGYPDRIAGDQIPLEARIVAVCDAYGAMRSERSYRSRATHAEAVAELQRGAGSQFDPQIVETFVALFVDRPPQDDKLDPGDALDPLWPEPAAGQLVA